jgi:hypothetical protein
MAANAARELDEEIQVVEAYAFQRRSGDPGKAHVKS